jgi:secondary thiamine-phosphate synthase enzyme
MPHMAVVTETISLVTRGFGDTHDLTPSVQDVVLRSGVTDGIVCISVPGSTGGITTVELEEGVLEDLREALERLVPSRTGYKHDTRWGDGNGFAHVRAALVGASQCFPVVDRKAVLGTWQQIVFLDFDNRSRSRRIIVQVMGDREE